jgi:hypothetical protein
MSEWLLLVVVDIVEVELEVMFPLVVVVPLTEDAVVVELDAVVVEFDGAVVVELDAAVVVELDAAVVVELDAAAVVAVTVEFRVVVFDDDVDVNVLKGDVVDVNPLIVVVFVDPVTVEVVDAVDPLIVEVNVVPFIAVVVLLPGATVVVVVAALAMVVDSLPFPGHLKRFETSHKFKSFF